MIKNKNKEKKASMKKKVVRKKLFKNKNASKKVTTKSSSVEEPQYVNTDNEDSGEEECMYCTEPYKNDVNGEKWIC